jgi:hypothetical protein
MLKYLPVHTLFIVRLRATLEKHFGSASCLRFLPVGGKGSNTKGATFVSGGRDSIL